MLPKLEVCICRRQTVCSIQWSRLRSLWLQQASARAICPSAQNASICSDKNSHVMSKWNWQFSI